MKCPHCEYEYSFNSDSWLADQGVRGDRGDFYKLPIEMQRKYDNYRYVDIERRSLYGCPSCDKTFIAESI